MFATNYSKLTRDLGCEGQCGGECNGHNITLKINNTANVGCIVIDGVEELWLSSDQADALYHMFKTIKDE